MFFLSTTRHILPLLSQSHFKKCHYSPVIAHNFIIVVRLLLEYLSLEFSFTSVVQRDLEGWRWNADLFVILFYIVRGPFPNTPKRTKTQIVLERFKIVQVHIYWSLWIVISATVTWKKRRACLQLVRNTPIYIQDFFLKVKPHKLSCIYWEYIHRHGAVVLARGQDVTVTITNKDRARNWGKKYSHMQIPVGKIRKNGDSWSGGRSEVCYKLLGNI